MAVLYETVPGTEVPAGFTSEKLMVLAWTASLNVAVRAEAGGTLIVPDAGVSLVTIGAPEEAVVNDQAKADDMATPLLFCAPLTVAVYVVL